MTSELHKAQALLLAQQFRLGALERRLARTKRRGARTRRLWQRERQQCLLAAQPFSFLPCWRCAIYVSDLCVRSCFAAACDRLYCTHCAVKRLIRCAPCGQLYCTECLDAHLHQGCVVPLTLQSVA